MWLDLQKMVTDHARPAGLKVEAVETAPDWDVDELPYYSKAGATQLHAAIRLQPQRAWHFGAWLNGKPVGHSALFLTTGELGIAGIYGCGVVPDARNRGIGKAVTQAACQQARAMGCPVAMLNATGMGEPMYRRLGFESLGYGRTWWLDVERLASRRPTQTQIAVAEAVGRGDLDALDLIARKLDDAAFDRAIPCGMTLVELAVHAGEPESVEWLAARGATLDVVSAWNLGWKDRAPRLLAEAPELANFQSASDGATPLHVAAAQNDVELARVVLAANPDLSIDNNDAGTPLHQACWFGHVGVVKLLLRHNPPLDARNRYGGTPLSTAIYGSLHCRNPEGGYAAVVESLIAAGSPLPETASGSEKVVEVLRRHGVKG
jgi:GNAT superfamily N-acetyltransferase